MHAPFLGCKVWAAQRMGSSREKSTILNLARVERCLVRDAVIVATPRVVQRAMAIVAGSFSV